jgi:hypothetical protein
MSQQKFFAAGMDFENWLNPGPFRARQTSKPVRSNPSDRMAMIVLPLATMSQDWRIRQQMTRNWRSEARICSTVVTPGAPSHRDVPRRRNVRFVLKVAWAKMLAATDRPARP